MNPPIQRFRRLRKSVAIRQLLAEHGVDAQKLIQPLFVIEGGGLEGEISAMPGQFRRSVDRLVDHCKGVADAGIGAVLLFGVPAKKDASASAAYDPGGVVQRAVAAIKESTPDLLIITDVCLCSYTDHGHCGIRRGGQVENDATVELLARTAVSHARAGADIVAPSDMMDGRVAGIRAELDRAGFADVAILSYAVKYASAFYGPFREAADSTPQDGDRRGYQMDPANVREAVRVAAAAEMEGADMIMVKPAMPYLDVVRRVRESSSLPLAAYQVSGEYAMIEAAARNGWLNREAAIDESLLAIRRAGADMIITYYATEIARRR